MRMFRNGPSRAEDNRDGLLYIPVRSVVVDGKNLLIEVMKSDGTFRIRSYPGNSGFHVYASGIPSFEAAKVALELLS